MFSFYPRFARCRFSFVYHTKGNTSGKCLNQINIFQPMLLEKLIKVYEEDFMKIHLTTFSKSEMSDIFILKKQKFTEITLITKISHGSVR